MEFINVEKKYRLEALENCSQRDFEALNNCFSSAELNSYVHQADNSFVDCSYGKTIKYMREKMFSIVGVCYTPPTYKATSDAAIVVENNKTFERFWLHVSANIISWWKEQCEE